MKYLFAQLYNRKEANNGSCIAVIPLHKDNVKILLGAEEMFKTFQLQYPSITTVHNNIDSFIIPSSLLDIQGLVEIKELESIEDELIGDHIEIEVGPYGIYFWDPEDHHWSEAINYELLKDLLQ